MREISYFFVRARAHVWALMTRKSCAVEMRDAILRNYLSVPKTVLSIKDTEHFCIGHSANHIFQGLHEEIFTHDGTFEVARAQANSELVILLLGKTVYPGSGLCTFLNDFQLRPSRAPL